MKNHATSLIQTYEEAGTAIRNFLRRRISRRDVADELLQETFLAAARRPDRLNAAQSRRAWLIGIARNILLEHLRRKSADRMESLSAEPAAPTPAVEDDRLEQMRSAIARLPEDSREVLKLRLLDDLSYAEIAEALNLPIGTIKSRIHNAVVKLRSRLGVKETHE